MRPDIVALLRSSDRAYVRQLIGMDPVAMFRWGILRATIRGIAAFNEAGRSWAAKTSGTLSLCQRQAIPGEIVFKDSVLEYVFVVADLNYANAKQRLSFLFLQSELCYKSKGFSLQVDRKFIFSQVSTERNMEKHRNFLVFRAILNPPDYSGALRFSPLTQEPFYVDYQD